MVPPPGRINGEAASYAEHRFASGVAGPFGPAYSGGEAESLVAGRFAIVNAWRSVRGTVRRSPLALCDASTLAPGDLVASERRAADRVGEIELASWNPAHRWYYYPAMTTGETLLLKTFDSADDGRATRTIHTAFESSDAAPDAPPRESIESRMLLFF